MVNVNVEPQSSILFHLAYEELLRRRLGSYEQLININPGQAASSSIPNQKISVHIEDSRDLIDVGASKTCSNLKMENDTEGITDRESTTKASISWILSKEDQRMFKMENTCQLLVQYDIEHNKKDDAGEILISNGYFVHFFAQDDLPPIPQHLVFILDISGSMRGEKMKQMKKAQIQILSEMRETDYFSIIIFDNQIELWTWTPPKSCKGQPVAASRKNLHEATSYIKTLQPRGGTDIHDAIIKGLAMADVSKGDDFDDLGSGSGSGSGDDDNSDDEPECSEKLPSNVKPLIIFLTDGQPTTGITNLDEILETIRHTNRDINVPILSLGFGSDVDFPFLKKLSLQNHGFARKIYEGSDASLQIRNFYREVSSLLLTDVTFRYTSMTSDISDLTETRFYQYFRGKDIVVAGKLDTTEFCGAGSNPSLKNLEKFLKADVTGGRDGVIKWLDIPANVVGPADCGHKGNLSMNEWNADLATPDDRFLEALWAYLTIRQLLDNEVASDVKGNSTSAGKEKALKLALKYGFVTPLTSLLAVTPGRSPSPEQHSQIATDDDNARVNGVDTPVDDLDFSFKGNRPAGIGVPMTIMDDEYLDRLSIGGVGMSMSNKAAIFISLFTSRFISFGLSKY